MRLILARHGNTFEKGQTPLQVGARTDIPLCSFGKEQAEKIGRYLLTKKLQPRAVFASRLKRQWESAQMIAAPFDLTVLEAPFLSEIDYGLWEGLTQEQIIQSWPEEYQKWTESNLWPASIFSSTESECRSALFSFFDYLKKAYGKEEIVVGVTSNGLLRLLGQQKVKTGHICEIDLLDHGFTIISWNKSV